MTHRSPTHGSSPPPPRADQDPRSGEHREGRLRDGIYVLRADDALVVKRLALHPAGQRVTVQSDNPAYPDWPDCDIGDLHCIGRVIWAGRKIG